MAVKDLAGALKLAEERNLRFVSLQFTDIVGAAAYLESQIAAREARMAL